MKLAKSGGKLPANRRHRAWWKVARAALRRLPNKRDRRLWRSELRRWRLTPGADAGGGRP